MLENDQAITCEMLVEGYAVADATKEIGEHVLALLERPLPQIKTVELDEIESAQHRGVVMLAKTRRSKTDRPSRLTTIASPSTTHERTGKAATAAAIFGKRVVKS